MLVSQILNSKPAQGVETVAPDTRIFEAAEVLSARKIGSLVVSKDGDTPLGILSERDIVRELGRDGAVCLNGKVSDYMTAKVVTCTLDQSADEVLETMTNGRFRHIPVMDGDKMVGLISIGDVVKARLSELAMERDALEGMIMGN